MIALWRLGTVIRFILPSQILGTVSTEAENRSDGVLEVLHPQPLLAYSLGFLLFPSKDILGRDASNPWAEAGSLYYLWLRDPDDGNPKMEGVENISDHTKKGKGVQISLFSRKN